MKTALKCNDCTLCCYNQFVRFQEGDNLSLNWVDDGGVKILAHKEGGACVYLTPSGCGNYESRPLACKVFDCRKLVEHYKLCDVDNKDVYERGINLLVLDRIS